MSLFIFQSKLLLTFLLYFEYFLGKEETSDIETLVDDFIVFFGAGKQMWIRRIVDLVHEDSHCEPSFSIKIPALYGSAIYMYMSV